MIFLEDKDQLENQYSFEKASLYYALHDTDNGVKIELNIYFIRFLNDHEQLKST